MYSAVESKGDVRRGSIGGGVMAPDQSMIGWLRRLHNEAGGEMGVLTVDVGGDCIRDGSASSSGVKHIGTLVGARSAGPMLEGVLVKEWMFPEVCQELIDRDWNGAGESIDVTDMVSRSGVTGSRYGFVVLMKVTAAGVRGGKSRLTLEGTYHSLEYPAR